MEKIKLTEVINIFFHEGTIPEASFSKTTFRDNIPFKNVAAFKTWLEDKVSKDRNFVIQKLCLFIHIKGNEFSEHLNTHPKANPQTLTETLRNELFHLYPAIRNDWFFITSDSEYEYIDTYQIKNICTYGKVIKTISDGSLKPVQVKDLLENKKNIYESPSNSENAAHDNANLEKGLPPTAIDSLTTFIKEFNGGFQKCKEYLFSLSTTDNWHIALFPFLKSRNIFAFESKLWQYSSSVFQSKLHIHKDFSDCTLISDCSKSSETIIFHSGIRVSIDGIDRELINQGEIKMNFFWSLSEREYFQDITPWNKKKVSVATRLYIMHEILHHTFHNLDYKNSDGIGSFPRVVEEADYHADAFAILCELAYYYYDTDNKDISILQLKEKIKETVRIAIETTFSFAEKNIRFIQIRRVNRYLIWFYIYNRVDEIYSLFSTKGKEEKENFLYEILDLFSIKPLLEIYGPKISINKDKNRVRYDLHDIDTENQQATFFVKNKIMNHGKTYSIGFEKLYSGLRDSDFDKVDLFTKELMQVNV